MRRENVALSETLSSARSDSGASSSEGRFSEAGISTASVGGEATSKEESESAEEEDAYGVDAVESKDDCEAGLYAVLLLDCDTPWSGLAPGAGEVGTEGVWGE